MLATAKHFAGDGLTAFGTGEGDYTIDQGIDQVSRREFDRLALAPYRPAIRKHHVGSVMPSFSSVDWTEDGLGNPVKMHANQELITDVVVPSPPPGSGSAYVSVEHPASGFALAGAAALAGPAGEAVAVTGIAGTPFLLRPDEEPVVPSDSTDRIGRGFGTERDLDAREPAGEQRFACTLRLVGVHRSQHGNDSRYRQSIDDVAHRASQPPSTGTTMPCT